MKIYSLEIVYIFMTFLVGACASPAFADEYIFKIRQKDSVEHVSSCVLQSDVCFSEMNISLEDGDLGVGIKMLYPYAEFMFVFEDEELSTAQQGWDQFVVNFDEANPTANKVTLYKMSADAKQDRGAGRLLVLRPPNQKLIDLEIEILAKDQPLKSRHQDYDRAEHEF